MKIAIYVPAWPPGSSANGIVTYAGQIIPALRKLGHEVYVLTPNLAQGPDDRYAIRLGELKGLRSFWHRLKSRVSARSSFKSSANSILSEIVRLKKQHRIDVLEIEESFGWSDTISAARVVPVVVRLHGPWFLTGQFDDLTGLGHQSRIEREGAGIRNATFVTSPSIDALRAVRSYYNSPLESARVIPNPITTADTEDLWRLDACETNRILYVGRFDRLKGSDLVLRAFTSLAETYPNLRLTFVGPDNGVMENGICLSFGEFVRENLPHLESRIDFLGQQSQGEVRRLRTRHFLTIVASRYEVFSYAVAEAMSQGCPVVAPNVGGIPELISNGETGLLFANQEVSDLIRSCRRLLDNPDLAARLGARARNACATSFAAASIAADAVSCYRTAVTIHRARHLT
ncbi:glycosyltransferase involved in cell wall biosynthesis [Bradyrhizobium sp. AZCC 1693]